MKAIEEEKARQEELKKVKEEEIKVIEKVEEFTAPVEVTETEEAEKISEETIELLSMSFKVNGTLEELKGLKNYMESVGIKYESI